MMKRETSKQAVPARVRVPMHGLRDGATRSSDESAVMALERRGSVVQFYGEDNRKREDLRG